MQDRFISKSDNFSSSFQSWNLKPDSKDNFQISFCQTMPRDHLFKLKTWQIDYLAFLVFQTMSVRQALSDILLLLLKQVVEDNHIVLRQALRQVLFNSLFDQLWTATFRQVSTESYLASWRACMSVRQLTSSFRQLTTSFSHWQVL